MNINGDMLIELLSLPSHDKRVLELLKLFNLRRPAKDENYNGVAINFDVDEKESGFSFHEKCETIKQKSGAYGNVDFYLNGIEFFERKDVTPPFGISWGEAYSEVKIKIGKKADYQVNGRKNKRIWLLKDSEKEYLLGITFDDDNLTRCVGFWMTPYNKDRPYNMPKNEGV